MFGTFLAAFLTACAADGVTTHQVMSRGGHEQLLPGSNRVVIDAELAGLAAAGAWSTHRLWTTGHKKAAILILVGDTAFHGWATAHNARQ